jgi:hypothetical protein
MQLIKLLSVSAGSNVLFYYVKRRFHGSFTSVTRSASLALVESFSFSWWLATSRQPRQRACATERASVELSHQLISLCSLLFPGRRVQELQDAGIVSIFGCILSRARGISICGCTLKLMFRI